MAITLQLSVDTYSKQKVVKLRYNLYFTRKIRIGKNAFFLQGRDFLIELDGDILSVYGPQSLRYEHQFILDEKVIIFLSET